ncbi:MAG TPA: aspartyl/asparaginyl beta-hydroxylase domain-containing protein [Dongiaceae bacterium]|nr:aspartyl/asparaginyl beta-hydroxylase domain-containing protein [Dongiaceae bacterium]
MNLSTVRLLKSFDVEKLKRDLDAAVQHFAPAAQRGSYHDGSWKGITLRNSTGDPSDPTAFSTSKARNTPVLNLCPYFREVLESLGCPVNVARLLFLPPGKVIGEHTDAGVGFDAGLVRLHIPIITNERVRFTIGGHNVQWRPGEFWYGNFAQAHSLHNASDQVRVHLVLDCEVTPETLLLFPKPFIEQVRAQTAIVETVPHPLSQAELQQHNGYLKLVGRALGLPLPILGRLQEESPYLQLRVPGIPLQYFLTVVEPGVLRSNLHQLTWSESDRDGRAAVEYRNLKTGGTLPFHFSRQLTLSERFYLPIQFTLLTVGYGLYVGINGLKRLLSRMGARSLES